ncbi:hypothetical protein CKA32_001915 [Geitlerinema sp. FC II]|nr:hypothetical protein [Geitlerinema sp. CS-897]PPT07738.1 hypothetical protein CKA32_001915 [Geitlerinema sp. FC II]
MVSVLQSRHVSVVDLRDRYGLTLSTEPDFFTELSVGSIPLIEREMQDLDRVKINFLSLLQKPPLLENSVKMVVVSPLLDLTGFYREPFRIESETSIELQGKDEE